MWKKVKLLKMSNFTFFHNVFFAICILKSFNSHISVVVFIFFEFGMVSKWCNREWVKSLPDNKLLDLSESKACDKVNVPYQKLKLFLKWEENVAGKGDELVTSIFSFSHTIFNWHQFQGHLNLYLCYKGQSKFYTTNFSEDDTLQ